MTNMSAPEAARVRCPECGRTRVVSARQAARVRSGVHSGTCPLCKRLQRKVSDAHRRFWLNRMSIEEIHGMACQMWPSTKPMQPMSMLVASGGKKRLL
jgi:hypothetical protein